MKHMLYTSSPYFKITYIYIHLLFLYFSLSPI
jgi:hypothetical protein